MRSKLLRSLPGLGFVQTTILAFASGSAIAQAGWTVTNLHPDGALGSAAYGASGAKQTGYAVFDGIQHAATWGGTAGSFVNLQPLDQSSALAADGTKQAGWSLVSGFANAALWSGTPGSFTNLNPSGASVSQVNAAVPGQQAGSASLSGETQAGIWSGSAASWVSLHPASGAWESIAYGTDGSQQVGYYMDEVDFFSHAALWSGTAGSMIDLHPTGTGVGTESIAYAVDSGQQGGYVKVSGDDHASLWSGSAASWVDLHPVDASQSFVLGVHNGMQVGRVVDGSGYAAFWEGTAASLVNLHDFLPSYFDNSYAQAISSDAANIYVVGHAFNGNTARTEALLWTLPIPEPGGFALATTAFAVLCGRLLRNRRGRLRQQITITV